MSGLARISFGAADCNAGCQGEAARPCKIPGACFSEEEKNSACGGASKGTNVSRSLSSVKILFTGFGVPPPKQLEAGGHLGTQGTSWGPCELGDAVGGLGHTGDKLSSGMLRIGRRWLADNWQGNITHGVGTDSSTDA
eukprot:1159798-Pelagomonas_calceolata.AAC.8